MLTVRLGICTSAEAAFRRNSSERNLEPDFLNHLNLNFLKYLNKKNYWFVNPGQLTYLHLYFPT